jgi:ankyrin repeat protein
MNQIQMVEILLKMNCKLNLKTRVSFKVISEKPPRTALDIAMTSGNRELVQLLSSYGAKCSFQLPLHELDSKSEPEPSTLKNVSFPFSLPIDSQ